jgi:hypothetical protein
VGNELWIKSGSSIEEPPGAHSVVNPQDSISSISEMDLGTEQANVNQERYEFDLGGEVE